MPERSKDWMDEAQGDLDHARNDTKSGFHNWACFSSQQAAEKGIKAVFRKSELRHGGIRSQIY